MNDTEKGILYIVSTPIGNMADISARAIECLSAVDAIACEDTRHSGRFLSHIGVKNKLMSYHDHNAGTRSSSIIEMLNSGSSVALISDAGTPGVSDPAYRVVKDAVAEDIIVQAIPGASSLLAALVVSGLPLDRFCFEGFLPPKGAKRLKRIEDLMDETRTIIFLESPHRINKLLNSIYEILGDREISVSRELTKLHEETVRGYVRDVYEKLQEKKPRGEYTVVLRGKDKKKKGELKE